MLCSARLPELTGVIHSVAPDGGSVVSVTDGVSHRKGPPGWRPFCYLSYGIWRMRGVTNVVRSFVCVRRELHLAV